jgi:hypothetical protein
LHPEPAHDAVLPDHGPRAASHTHGDPQAFVDSYACIGRQHAGTGQAGIDIHEATNRASGEYSDTQTQFFAAKPCGADANTPALAQPSAV